MNENETEIKQTKETKIKEITELERNNNIAMKCHFADVAVMLLFVLLQVAAGYTKASYFIMVFIIGAAPVVAEIFFWKRDHETKMIKHLVAIGFALFYTVIIFTSTNSLVFVFAIPMILAVTVYNDLKYILKINTGTVLESIIVGVLGAQTGGFGYAGQDNAVIQGVIMIMIAFYSAVVTRTMDKNNQQKVKRIETVQEKTNILLNDLSEMSAKMKTGIKNINEGLENLSRESEATTESMSKLAEVAGDTAQAVQRQDTKTREINDKVENTSDTAENIMNDMRNTLEVLDKGSKAVDVLVEKSTQSVENGSNVADKLNTLNKFMDEMNSIVGMIDEIASQTDLLSLNASIEAARAGEAGRGFSVVATEISKMARQTKDATVHISDLITNVTNSIKEVIEVIYHMIEGINEEKESTENTAENFSILQKNTVNICESLDSLVKNIEVLKIANQEIVEVVQTISTNADDVTESAEKTMEAEERNAAVLVSLEKEMQELMELIKE